MKTMKLTAKIITLATMAATATPSAAQLSEYDMNKPVGWAMVDGETTGGNDENHVTVTTPEELKAALTGTGKKTVYVKGEIEFATSLQLKGVQNKTIYGLPGSALVNKQDPVTTGKSGILTLSSCKNIILRNLTFKGSGAYDMDGKDNLSLLGSSYVWVDHCDFQDGVDGNFDCTNASNNICVTWCRFSYSIAPWPGGPGGSDDHRFTNLWGSSDSASGDNGKLNTTFANCWWDKGCRERMPRVRYGKVHLVNCLYTCTGNSACVGAGYKANVYVEKCAFANVKSPWKKNATKQGYTDFNITMTGNTGASDTQMKSGGEPYFIPADYYELEGYDVSLVEAVVSNPENGAGATLDIKEGDTPTTGISSATGNDARIMETRFHNASGMELSAPQSGLNIIRQRMSDGTVRTLKVMKR